MVRDRAILTMADYWEIVRSCDEDASEKQFSHFRSQ